jgi:HSP20 family molecular chaperone IbpA
MVETGQDVVRLRNAFDQLWNESFGSPFRTLWTRPAVGAGNGNTGAPTAPLPLDVFATKDAFVIVAAVPGMRQEDLAAAWNQGTLTLSGTVGNVADSGEAKGATWYLKELWHGRYERAITPPFEVDPARAEAAFEHGVLRITLPKAAGATPQQIPVRFGGATTRTQALTENTGEQNGQAEPAVEREPAAASAR